MSNTGSPPDDGDELTVITTPGAAGRARVSPPMARPKPAVGGLQVGQRFAERFVITRVIGSGGMGLVHLANDEQQQRTVAIKTIQAGADAVLEARFRREARLIEELRHPNIVELVAFGEVNGVLYLAMEFIEGETLSAVLQREGALAWKRAVGIALQLAEALVVAHRLNVVHRDIKPDNIMITRDAEGREHVKVLDFGVAKIKREAGARNVTVQTQAGAIIGSLRYITPEQVHNADVTPRTDMYLFGCVLHELVVGRRVFDYKSPSDCAVAHVMEAPKPPQVAGVAPKTAKPLVDFMMRCLAKKPEARPADARAAVTMLRAL